MDEDSLPPSELGLKEYWDKHYNQELNNFEEHGDYGEIWFGKGITKRMVTWLNEKFPSKKDTYIIDVGCGNGFMLVSLLKLGFKKLTGVDYSDDAIALAKKIASQVEGGSSIVYQKQNILSDQMLGKFDVVIDKGTYDAICLNPKVEDIKPLKESYISYVTNSIAPNGYFIICSCNWTKEELLQHFSKFNFLDEIPSPSISFGGKQGNRVTCLVFSAGQ